MAVLVVAAGCSLMVDFGEESQPCTDAGLCDVGFRCENLRCVRADGGADAGLRVDAGLPRDGGSADGGPSDGGPSDGGR